MSHSIPNSVSVAVLDIHNNTNTSSELKPLLYSDTTHDSRISLICWTIITTVLLLFVMNLEGISPLPQPTPIVIHNFCTDQ